MVNILIYGASDLGCSVASMLSEDHQIKILGFIDDNLKAPKHMSRFDVLGNAEMLRRKAIDASVIVCIGENEIRKKISVLVKSLGYSTVGYIHPYSFTPNTSAIHDTAIIFPFAYIGEGCKVGAFTVIHPNSTLSSHSIVGDYCLIAPNSTIGSGVSIETGVSLGLSASVLPGLTIGRNSTIAASAAVTKNVPNDTIAKGVPARW